MSCYVNQGIVRQLRKGVTVILLVSFACTKVVVRVVEAEVLVAGPVVQTELAALPDSAKLEVKELPPKTLKTIRVASTAYTSRMEECDSDPFVTADGSDVSEGVVATNILPFGTKIRLPTVFGDRIFTVHDRMNARYSYRVDIWMKDMKEARAYGMKRNIPIEVIEWGNNKTNWLARAEQIKKDRLAAKLAKEIALAE